MTANEMKYEFLILYDKFFEYGAPSYDDKQTSTVLSKAQHRVSMRKYDALMNKYQKGFENSEKLRRELDNLIQTTTITDKSAGIHPNGYLLDLPSDFMFAIEESVITSLSAGGEVRVLPVTHDFYNRNIKNPYKKPLDTEVIWRMDIGKETGVDTKRTELIVGINTTTITSYRLEYLRTIPEIVCDEEIPANQVDSILDELVHHEIVDEAVKIAVAATTPEVYQISAKEQKDNES